LLKSKTRKVEKALTKSKQRKRIGSESIIAIIICTLVLMYLIGSIVAKAIDKNNYEKELEAKQATHAQIVEENSVLDELNSQDDEAKLAEDYAREKGYVMPDEHVFVDVTPGV
jgi:cell division protein FtsB